ncbi:MAG: ATP-binding protein, partial [Candidatus Margulisiibacteriota bacterium]
MERQLESLILKDLKKKMVFLTGPRQVGKTYLAKEIMTSFASPIYLNYDQVNDARTIQSQSWPLTADILVFDEIHKMKNWKNYLKGVFDTRQPNQAVLVTGSSRMETFRQTGSSLAGRYFHYRLYPFSVKEMKAPSSVNERLEKLNQLGGFPEPLLSDSEQEASRWRNQYATDLIREDILDFSQIHEVRAMRLLLELLRSRVGSSLSYKSLAEDLQISPNTVRKYVSILESLYIVFLITPYHRNIARSILKEPKLYFYDTGMVNGDVGKQL